MSETDNVEVAEVAEVATVATEAPVVSEATERPEWLPEKFKTPEDLASSYTSLEQKLGAGQEELRNQIIQEFETAALENRPASVGDYQVPETIDESLAVDNDLFKWWAEHSYENAYSQEEFEAGIAKYAEFISATQPNLEQERANLGENADARIESVSLWANKFFPEDMSDAIMDLGSTAKGVEALEFIMAKLGGASVGGDTTQVSQITDDNLRSMMQDERYWNPTKRDASYVKKVQEGFSQLYR